MCHSDFENTEIYGAAGLAKVAEYGLADHVFIMGQDGSAAIINETATEERPTEIVMEDNVILNNDNARKLFAQGFEVDNDNSLLEENLPSNQANESVVQWSSWGFKELI